MSCLLGYFSSKLGSCLLFFSMFCPSDAILSVKRLFQVGFLTSRILSSFQLLCFPRWNLFCFSSVREFPLSQELLSVKLSLPNVFSVTTVMNWQMGVWSSGDIMKIYFLNRTGEGYHTKKTNILPIAGSSTKNVNFTGYDFSLWIKSIAHIIMLIALLINTNYW